MSKKTKAARADLLAKVPAGARRLKVKTAKGETKYKAVAELADTDEILVNASGEPIVMRAKPGRKAKADPQPVNDTIRELVKRKAASVAASPLRQAAANEPDSDAVLHNVLMGLTDEVASLAFERQEAERLGKETSQISVRRIGGLKATAETWLKRKDQLVNKSVDPDSPGFKAAASYLLETMKEAMSGSGVRPEMIQTVFTKFSTITAADSWEAELKVRIKKSV
tara:strand:+ start:24513 stop:25187 length:675 start_codon:yes stop_codon:yes gene_type:complete